MLKITCDRCGKDITYSNKIGYVAISYGNGFMGNIKAWPPMDNTHFCEECIEGLLHYLFPGDYAEEKAEGIEEENSDSVEVQAEEEDATDEPPASETEAVEESGQKKCKKIDYGKINALHNAGWSNAKIADEMNMKKTAVANAIWKMKKEQSGHSEDI